MRADLLHLAAPVLGLAADVAFQVAYFRAKKALLRSLGAGFALGLAVTTALDLWTLSAHGGDPWILVANVLLFCALGYGYFHFVNLGETARRIRILQEIRKAGGSLSQEELLAAYNARAMVSIRLERLKSKNQVAQRQGRLYARPSFLLVAVRIMALFRRLLGLKNENRGLS
ncbi:MAG: hypothetical protein JRI97_08855 [Deltaproteobacteria bacterium]|nr:hypothetical protein [Deltaproteobacteria bacterium]